MAKTADKETTRFPGVRLRKHKTRKHGVRFDENYFIRHRIDGKLIEESCGWSSEGWTVARAYERLAEFKKNTRKGVHPRSMKELRDLNIKEKERLDKEDAAMKLHYAQEQITFGELFRAYADAGTVRKNAKVRLVEKGRFNTWLAPWFGDTPVIQVTPENLEALQAKILAKGRSPQTASHVIDLFRATWRWAQKRKLVQKECPVVSMERVRVANIKERWFTSMELHKLLQWLAEHDPHTKHLVLCAAHTGARLGELARLTWGNIDIAERQINFNHTKTGKPRSVPMSQEVVVMLSGVQAGSPEGNVFLQRNGLPFYQIKDGVLLTSTPYYFRGAIAALKLNEGYTSNRTKLNFHSLRHMCATTLLRAGTDPRTVQEILGWSTMKMLERYAHVVPAAKRKAIHALSGMYGAKED